jgi:hypothetical protein
MFNYYKITCNTSEKYVKTTSESCEIYLKSDFGNKYEKINKPYPIWDGEDFVEISETEFIHAIGCIDLNFKMRRSPNNYYRFNVNKSTL